MDQFALLTYLQNKDRKLSDTSVNTRLAGSSAGLKEVSQERAILAALCDLVRASHYPRYAKGTIGKPREVEVEQEIAQAVADIPPAEGPEFDPEPDLAALRAADEAKRIAAALAKSDPSLAPSPPAPFVAARNVGGRPRKDGSPAQPRTP